MIRLSTDEAWETLSAAHTGVLTTLRGDGSPVALPVWFVVVDRTIGIRTPSATKKLARIRRDPRASFLVESGEHWGELLGVHLTGQLAVVDIAEQRSRIEAALDAKYADYRPVITLPARAQARYASSVIIRFTPHDRILSWDNARI